MDADCLSIDAEYARRRELHWRRARHFSKTYRSAARNRAVAVGVIVLFVMLTEKEITMAPKALVAIPAAYAVALIVRRNRAARACRRAVLAARYYERRIECLNGDWAGRGESGMAYLSAQHPSAFDLDLFGVGSLFELLCTARTQSGQTTLAAWLATPAPAAEIRARQAAVADLRPRLDLQEDLVVLAAEVIDENRLTYFVRTGTEKQPEFSRPFQWTALTATVIAVAALAAYWLVGIAGSLVFAALLPHVAVASGLRRRSNRVLEPAFAARPAFGPLAAFFARLEREQFSSIRVCELCAVLTPGGRAASRRLLYFEWILRLELPALLLGMRPQLALFTRNRRREMARLLEAWLRILGEMESLAAIANRSREHPTDSIPEIVEVGPLFEAEGLGHPFLPEPRCIRNDVILDTAQPLLIVSGSNMSGKSTFLRTVGINAVLALCGATVRASRLRLSPFVVGATVRIQDSLREGRSRFLAEAMRIRQLLDMAGGAVPLLFLLDELFQGTNSRDRRTGAEAILRTLVDRGAVGMVTTHDLSLTEIADCLGPRAGNFHFTDQIVDGVMTFDYCLRQGVVPASNAIALLRSLGIKV